MLPESVLKIRDRATPKSSNRRAGCSPISSLGPLERMAKCDELEADSCHSRSARRVRNRCPSRHDLGMFELVLDTHSAPLPCPHTSGVRCRSLRPSTVEVSLIWKTRPHRKPELASDDDAVESEDETGMELSQSAIDAGWTGLTEGPPQQVSTAILRRGLADLGL